MNLFYFLPARRQPRPFGRLGWLAALLLALLTAPAARAQTLDWQSATSLLPATAGAISSVQAVATDSLGNQYLTGYFTTTLTLGGTTLTSAGAEDLFVAARTPAGTWLWAYRAGGAGSDKAQAIAVTGRGPSARVFVTGNTAAAVLVVALTGDGSWLWTQQTSGSSVSTGPDVSGYGIAATGRGSAARVYVTGIISASNTFGSAPSNMPMGGARMPAFVAALDGSGNWLWCQGAGGNGTSACRSGTPLQPGACNQYIALSCGQAVQVEGSGATARVYVTGYTTTYATSATATNFGNAFYLPGKSEWGFLASLDAAGNWLWVQPTCSYPGQAASPPSANGSVKFTSYQQCVGTGLTVLGSGSAALVYAVGRRNGATYVSAYKATGALRWTRFADSSPYPTSIVQTGPGPAPQLAVRGAMSSYGPLRLGNTVLTTTGSGLFSYVATLDTAGTWQAAQWAGSQRGEFAYSYGLAADPATPGRLLVGGRYTGTLTAGATTLTTAPVATSVGTTKGTGWLGTLALNPAGLAVQLTALTPGSGPVGTLVTLTGSNLNLVTTVSFNGTVVPAASFVSQSATTLKVRVPSGATTGLVVASAANGVGAGLPFTVTSGTAPGPLVVSTGNLTAPTAVAAGSYSSLTVTGTGVAQLIGTTDISDAVLVQAGGTLLTACQPLTGAGSFTLAAGATLGICDPAGLSSTPGTGAVQTTGARSFSPDATYLYTGTQPQATGDALPAQVRGLTTTNAAGLTLSNPLSVRQTLTLTGAGDLLTGGQALTLLSDATGSALVVNGGSGQVLGDATVQRYIDPSLNAGAGYRHYSAPTTDATVASLATTSFAPTVNAAYNASATPAQVRPFPTVFGYDAARLSGTSNNLSAFDKGWFSPQALTDALAPGRGYTVQVSAAERVAFTGTLGTDTLSVRLGGNLGSTPATSGWALVGNPYPAPLDWSQVAAADRPGLDPALYVVQSTGPYRGGYRTVNNSVSTTPTGEALLATAQGFFVHVGAGQPSSRLTFRNSQRVTDYATAQLVGFQRPTADVRPLVRLQLSGPGATDYWVTYAEAGASAAFEPAFDALKLANSTGLNLGSAAGLNLSSSAGTEQLAIDGQAAFTAATGLPLTVGVPAAGTYSLQAATLANLPAGLAAWLLDAQTGQTTPLATGSSYSFQVTAAQATTLLAGRFTVRFGPVAPLATAATALAPGVSVYPNPARGAATVAGLAAGTRVALLDAVGRTVAHATADAAGAARLSWPAGLAAGLYVVRAAGQVVRLTVE